jgi:hypothetical protein
VGYPKPEPELPSLTNWVFWNKLEKGYSQVEGLDFDEIFAPISRLESIHILLNCATHYCFKLYQMDVKSTFLNGPIEEEVYVEQPLGFEEEEYPNHAYKLLKVFYELKQAPRVWYECLRNLVIENGFRIGKADSTLFTRKKWIKIYLCPKYILMISFLSPLINPFVMSLARS